MTMRRVMSDEARRILDHLGTTQPGDMMTYEFLSNLSGLNDLDRLRARFRTASNLAFRQWQMRFANERGVGYFRLDEGGKNAEVSRGIVKIRRGVRRNHKRHEAVEFARLDDLEKLAHSVNGATLHELKKISSRGARNRVARVIASQQHQEVSIAERTLEIFRRKKM
jgi:hypothetical protein